VSAVASAADSPLEWAIRARPRDGEIVSGDVGLVKVVTGGAMVAAIDGLGHGAAAAAAAEIAAAVVSGSDDRSVTSVMERCHQELRRTRGAAISLAWLSFGARTMTWLALGDVEGRLLTARRRGGRDRTLRLPSGVVGHDQPTLVPETVEVRRGDVIVLTTDGVDGTFADALELAGATPDIAARILRTHWDGTDDGLAVVLRWLPDGAPGTA
jgi:negative regulator of sigma-B (phosphoserine phosphatase)